MVWMLFSIVYRDLEDYELIWDYKVKNIGECHGFVVWISTLVFPNWKKDRVGLTTLEFDLDLLPFWFSAEDLSFVCFLALAIPVTTSNIVGTSLIMLNKRFLN